MRHRWNRSGYGITSRQCTACWATGTRWGKGSTSWQGVMPDGTRYSGVIPKCPGTPWIREPFASGQAMWTIRVNGHDVVMADRHLVAQFGREHVEDLLKRHNVPPLPEQAWEELTAA